MTSHRYQIVGMLGKGGHGAVYKAVEQDESGFERNVAIKVLKEESPSQDALDRLRDEARILGLIRDRAIVTTEPLRRVGDRWALVMEYIEGATLRTITNRGSMPPQVAAEIIAESTRALHAAWTQQGPDGQPLRVLHRDLKPANIQITRTGEVKILDFGIAKANLTGRIAETSTGVSGTPRYVAPERLRGIELPAGDIYSLGVTLAELLNGPATLDPDTVPVDATRAAPAVEDETARVRLMELSHAMIHPTHDQRPAARQIERECAEIAKRSAGISLRDWAEETIPELLEESLNDAWAGRVFEAEQTTQVVDEPVRARRHWPLLVAAIGVGLVSLGLLWNRPPAQLPEAPPSPLQYPAPVATPAPEPLIVTVQPTPVEPPPPQARIEPVRVWVRTRPYGTVTIRGKTWHTEDREMMLRPGSHTLELESHDGLKHSWKVEVSVDGNNSFCWDFGTGRSC